MLGASPTSRNVGFTTGARRCSSPLQLPLLVRSFSFFISFFHRLHFSSFLYESLSLSLSRSRSMSNRESGVENHVRVSLFLSLSLSLSLSLPTSVACNIVIGQFSGLPIRINPWLMHPTRGSLAVASSSTTLRVSFLSRSPRPGASSFSSSATVPMVLVAFSRPQGAGSRARTEKEKGGERGTCSRLLFKQWKSSRAAK